MIWLPLLIITISRDPAFPFPKSVGDIFFLPRDVMFYFAHDFGLRHWFTRLDGRLKSAIGAEATDYGEVIVGKEGWMYLRMALPNGDLPSDELRRQLTTHQARADLCRELGIAYYVVPVPAKENVYPEHLPPHLRNFVPEGAQITQLQRYLLTKGDRIHCVLLLAHFRNWKSRGELFFKSDVHWNELGGFVASLETMRQILPRHGHPPPPVDLSFTVERRRTTGGNQAQILGIRNQTEEDYPVVTVKDGRSPSFADGRAIRIDAINFFDFERTGMQTVCADGELESAIVFHDSFGPALAPFLSRYFRTCHFHWQEFSEALVREKRPAVVIDLVNTF